MKINDLMGDVISRYAKQSKVETKNTSANAADKKNKRTVSTKEDRVEISKNAKILLQLGEGDRSEKLNNIKLAINNGTYKPDTEETAKAILKEWLGE